MLKTPPTAVCSCSTACSGTRMAGRRWQAERPAPPRKTLLHCRQKLLPPFHQAEAYAVGAQFQSSPIHYIYRSLREARLPACRRGSHHRTIQESTLSLGEEVTLPWRRLFSPIESGGQGGRRLGAERQGRRYSALHRPSQHAAPAIAARCIKHRSALPFRGLHRSPLTASHSLPSVMPKQTKKLRDERHRTALSEFLFTLSIPPGGHSLQLPYRSCSRRS